MSSSDTRKFQDLLSQALAPARAALLQGVLDDYASRISLDNAAQVLVGDASQATSLCQWVAARYRDLPSSMTVRTSSAEETLPAELVKVGAKATVTTPEDAFTHVISEVGLASGRAAGSETVLRELKNAFYALKPKGYAVVTCLKPGKSEAIVAKVLTSVGRGDLLDAGSSGDDLDEGELIDIAEEAQFERGKIRWSERKERLDDQQCNEVISQLRQAFKELLDGPEHARGWEETFDAAVKEEVNPGDGLVYEARLLLAMRWDLLCA